MAQQENQVAGSMISKDVDDDKRLYECAKTYDTIMKQFGELMGIMNNGTTAPKCRKSGKGGASSSQPSNNKVLAQTVTRFLHELRASPTDSESSKGT